MSKKGENREQDGFPPGLSAPARRALEGAGIERLEQLSAMSEADLKRLHGMGPNAIGKLRSALAEAGLAFAEGGTK